MNCTKYPPPSLVEDNILSNKFGQLNQTATDVVYKSIKPHEMQDCKAQHYKGRKKEQAIASL